MDRLPTPTQLTGSLGTCVFVPTIVVPNELAIWFAHPSQLRNAVGERCKPVGGFSEFPVKPRIFQCYAGVASDRGHDRFRALVKHSDIRMTEEQTAENGSITTEYGHRQITVHRQVPRRLAIVRCVMTIARVARDVVAADNSGAGEGQFEHRCVAR